MADNSPQPSRDNAGDSLPTPVPAKPPAPSHTRTYQACIPCRQRKVRCDLGSVDNPHDPPCVRCRREHKHCFFSATRRKRKSADEEGEGEAVADGTDNHTFHAKRPRKNEEQIQSSPALPLSHLARSNSAAFAQPLTPGGSFGRAQPLRRPFSASPSSSVSTLPLHNGIAHQRSYSVVSPGTTTARADAKGEHLTNDTAAELLSAEVYSGHDALNLLYEAADRSGDIQNQRVGSQPSAQVSPLVTSSTPASRTGSTAVGPRTSIGGGEDSGARNASVQLDTGQEELQGESNEGFALDESIGVSEMEAGLKAWSRSRFVRAGWFTAREAILYIRYFYAYLAPLTPISPPTYRDPSTHSTLLEDEPLLAVTLLTISSRHMQLSGPGGLSRSFAVHDKLWAYLRGMIDRVLWGQEQFGGGFCGAGAIGRDGSLRVPSETWKGLRKGSLRTLGTVEALMLLTEWHPRALHFPPGDDDEEVVAREQPATPPEAGQGMFAALAAQGGISGKRIGSWLEPAWRSDRMCWMLLGNALTLGFELGIFDDVAGAHSYRGHYRPEFESPLYRRRAKRAQRLLLIYLTSTSGRLGWTNIMSKPFTHLVFANQTGLKPTERKDFEVGNESVANEITEDCIDYCWIELASLMQTGNEMLFSSVEHTRNIIRNGQYVERLEYFQPRLQAWRNEFLNLDIPIFIRHILEIEYGYVRVYINSLALQAVIERFTNAKEHSEAENNDSSSLTTLYANNEYYIHEVVEGSRGVLRTVVDGLYPGGYLKHAPVRTVFRVEDEAAVSLGLMDSAVHALRTCVVDDVHLVTRFADLLGRLTQILRSRFLRVSTNPNSGSRQRGKSSSPVAGDQPAAAAASRPNSTFPNGPFHPPSLYHDQTTASSMSNTNNQFFDANHPSNTHPHSNLYTPNPLEGISTESIDPHDSNIWFMPPPMHVFTPHPQSSYDEENGNSGATPAPTTHQISGTGPTSSGRSGASGLRTDDGGGGAAPTSGSSGSGHTGAGAATTSAPGNTSSLNAAATPGYTSDWLALPLDPLRNSYGAGVNQTTYGPDIGGYDLLEVLLSEMQQGGEPVLDM
ncbi:hypothetical protein L228DRAFT_235952 [Xylona heveae TC161]|uniref:Zn(2)-C6 fungal-type domain-containing protein n=1 Tax=Xylona heveae (strain CBS 132557 / TC161) TaxID=1328760 RepID=A0A165K3M9_XYLHT|nr:hypothetical protein L228DRAFT_235952 [Xylona heveae TC161]KZF26948.1 hypothetical protein L228DRAFT_235952 [Xylona heveae TC161]